MTLTFETIIGKHMLIGISYYGKGGDVIEKKQLHGIVDRADEENGIVIIVSDTGQEYTMPPDLMAIQIAPKGEYRLESTGEVVSNPDLLSSWSVNLP